ncbi:aminotransferase class III-fold pyridoxal phosphate-dependent enzyme [uncultured Agrococcus sp.]|uniref:aminotransferase class III-fold pyridoxal phosphate-dependent enzyme n=1 Tax=uncultured Agrococcus sp. TaxID=382258 RepID=UPI0025E133AB|nr:aminotransferase class III-fold pyridoxal phosphate-dependent enzyme [uncultured Agrococcus sp.]
MTDTAQTTVRSVVTEIPGPKSKQMLERKAEAVSTAIPSNLPVFIESANGATFTDVDGNTFIDLGCGIGVTTIGHTNEAVVAAVREQVGRLTHSLVGQTPYEPYVRAAELLNELTPGDHKKKTIFVNSGAEAVENGVKFARKYTGRRGVAVLDHGYHGRTALTGTMNFKIAPYANGQGPTVSDVFHAPNSYPLRDGLDGAAAAKRTQWYLEKHVGVEDLACLVVEPIQGEGGFIVPADGYLAAMQEWCTKNGVVMIADEIQSGVSRTGATYASELLGWTPDVVLTAKGIAGGMPLAAVTGRAEIMDAMHLNGVGGTFGGNPVSCAAAIAVLEQVKSLDLSSEAKRIEEALVRRLSEMKDKYSVIAEVRGRGAMIGVELVDTDGEPVAAGPFAAEAGRNGVMALTAGADGNILRFLPSLIITNEQLEEGMDVIDEAFATVLNS